MGVGCECEEGPPDKLFWHENFGRQVSRLHSVDMIASSKRAEDRFVYIPAERASAGMGEGEARELAKQKFCKAERLHEWSLHADRIQVRPADFPS